MVKTLVIGASLNPERYSFKAVEMLRHFGHEVTAFGPKTGSIGDVLIENTWDENWKIDTVTLYLNPERQIAFYEKIITLKPQRVIFIRALKTIYLFHS